MYHKHFIVHGLTCQPNCDTTPTAMVHQAKLEKNYYRYFKDAHTSIAYNAWYAICITNA